MFEKLSRLHTAIQSRVLRYWRAREVVKSLQMVHAQELAQLPPNMWAQKKSEHAKEISAVKAGQFPIVDRRSWAFPYIPEALHRLNQPILKNTPYNLRRFTETPIPRRAINLVKNALLSLNWHITIDEKFGNDEDPEALKRADIATYCLEHPNLTDSYRTLMEAVIEDFLIGGYGAIEPQLTPDYRRPIKCWPIDGSTIRIYADWTESTQERPHYAQLTGLKGEKGIISFLDDELVYIKDNVRSSTPFGLGRCEVAFLTINAFLGAQDMASRAAADQIHKTWLWWQSNIPAGQMETVRRHIQNEAEGQAKVSLMGGLPKPDTVELIPVTPEDLLLDWQELLIRIIASAFELSPLSLGLEKDVNRNTANVLAQQDFNAAVVPAARKIEEGITRQILHRTLGWLDLKFEFLGLDDPDEMVQTQMVRSLYMVNAITPDEIREMLQLGEDLPGGFGKLNQAQYQILIASLTGKGGGMTGSGALGMGGPGGGMGGSGMGGMGSGGMNAAAQPPLQQAGQVQSLDDSPFDANDIAQMDPQLVELYRQAGLLPQDPNQLQTEMESQQPGILQTLSEELLEYFEWWEEQESSRETQPAQVTAKDMKDQQQKYRQRQHQITKEEAMARGRDFRTNLYESQGYRGKPPMTGKQFLPKGATDPKNGSGSTTSKLKSLRKKKSKRVTNEQDYTGRSR